jgi:DNA-binding PadR family transcriptional regulator
VDLGVLQKIDHAPVKLKEVIDLQLLYLLSESPSSGYALNKKMLKEFGLKISYGTLYPKLAYFEKAGILSSSWQRNDPDSASPVAKRKRIYRLTEYGQGILKERLAELAKMFRFA